MITEKMIEVIEAFDNGNPIEAKIKGEDTWFTTSNPVWNFAAYDYRIKGVEKEEPNPLMTVEQLAELLSKGFGVCKDKQDILRTGIMYFQEAGKKPVSKHTLIRPWGSDTWIKPTVDIYEKFVGA